MNKRLQAAITAGVFSLLCVLVPVLLPPAAGAVSPPPGTVLVNLVTATYTDANGNSDYTDAASGEILPLAVSASVQSLIGAAPRLEISSLASNDPVAAGGLLTYTINYRNIGNTVATNVTITDLLSRHLNFASASGNGLYLANPDGSGTVAWNIGTLAAGENGAVTILSRVKTAADYPPGDPETVAAGTLLANLATIQATAVLPISTALTTTVGSSPNLELSKFSPVASVEPGGRMTYTLVYRNSGNLAASNVRLRDQLPEGVAYVPDSLTVAGNVSGQVVTVDLGSLPAGGEGEVSFQVTVSPDMPEGSMVKNTAVILCNELDPIPSNQTSNEVAPVSSRPSLLFMKLDSPDPVFVGNPIVYTLEITNDGEIPLSNIEVRDHLPAQTIFNSGDGGAVCDNDSGGNCVEVVWQIETLAAGETGRLHLKVLVAPDTASGAVITNSAVAIVGAISVPSPMATTTTIARTPGRIEFLDAGGQSLLSYGLGDIVYLQVTDLDRNTDSSLIETVIIIVENKVTGDLESIVLTETGAGTGVFRGEITSNGAAGTVGDQIITLAPDTVLVATYTDPLDAAAVVSASALIEPFGVVFDSISGALLGGAIVTLIDDSTGLPFALNNPVTTGTDGGFKFAPVPTGTYHFTVEPPAGYVFASQISDSALPAGFNVTPASRGTSFTVAAGDPPLNFDIPVDPPPGRLLASKGANRNEAAIGDVITYTLIVRNNGPTLVQDLEIRDTLPAGIHYLDGSSQSNGLSVPEPLVSGAATLVWPMPPLGGGETLELSYQCLIAAGAGPGLVKNIFSATGSSVGQIVTSNRASHTIRISEGVFSSTSTIIGKVFANPGPIVSPALLHSDVGLELSSVLEGSRLDYHLVKYAVDIKLGPLPVRNLRLAVILPEGVNYQPGSSSFGATALPDPEVTGNTISYRLGDVGAGRQGRVLFLAGVAADGADRELTARAALTFDTAEAKDLQTVLVENTLTKESAEQRQNIADIIMHPKFAEFGYTLSAKDRAAMDRIIAEMNKVAVTHMFVTGHTDSSGIAPRSRHLMADNHALSHARAEAVGAYFIAGLGLAPEQVTFAGKGSAEPVASNKTAEGRALNRRVELRFIAEKVDIYSKLDNLKASSGLEQTEFSVVGERNWIMLAFPQGVPGYDLLAVNMEEAAGSGGEDNYYDNGRLAFSVRGRIRGRSLLDAAGALAENRVKKFPDRSLPWAIDPDCYYYLYGDDSPQEDGRGPRILYLKIERDELADLFGEAGSTLAVTELRGYGTAAGDSRQVGQQGLPGVVLYLEDGTRVVTDQHGKYSIPGVRPGNHVLRLDESTLPAGYVVKKLGNRSFGAPTSQFIDLAPGLLFKADFTVSRPGPAPKTAASAPGGPPDEAALPGVPRKISQLALEEQIKGMTPELAILSPAAGTQTERSQTGIVIKGPEDGTLALLVNDLPVAATKVGRTINDKDNRVQIQEYVSVGLVGGMTNRITVTLTDPFGNRRDSKTITVRVPGKPAAIAMTLDRLEVPADGNSVIGVSARILDANNTLLTYPRKVTVVVTDGEIIDEDLDPGESGYQIACTAGIVSFQLRAPRETGMGTITVLFDELVAEREVFFSPHLREMMVVGIGEVEVGRKSEKRGAFFAKGEVGGGVLLTASYDSDKAKSDDLFRTSAAELGDEAKYPLLGDESSLGYEAQSREKLFFKLEKDKSSLLLGDYRTELQETTLSPYNRSFNGLLADIDSEYLTLRAFGARTSQTQVVATLPGRGISGYYRLDKVPVLEGSERVVIEVRDRFRPERVLSREKKNRFSDYDIDYSMGTLLFKGPIPGHDAEWNPVYIIVTYENESEGDKYYTYGGRAGFKPFRWLELGITSISEEKATDDYRLLGADLTLALPAATTVKGEYSHSDSLFDLDNALQQLSGEGWSLSVASKPATNLDLTAYYQKTGEYFDNPSAVSAGRGKEKYGFDLKLALAGDQKITATAFEERDDLNDMSYSHLSTSLEKRFSEKTTATVEVSHEEATDNYVAPPATNSRSPFDISDETPERLTAAKIAITTKIRPDLALLLSHKQDLLYNDYNLSQAGFDYQVSELNRLYLREEYGQFGERSELRTVIGGETKLIKNTVAFDEYRLENGSSGARNQQVIGLRNKFMLRDNLTGNFTLENSATLTGLQRNGQEDAFAVTGGLEYLPLPDTKVTSRLEYRTETSGSEDHSFLAELGAAQRMSSSYTLLLRERYFLDNQESSERTTSDLQVGVAFRPVADDRFNGLGKLTWRHEDGTATAAAAVNTYILATEGVYQANRDLQLIAKYAGKYVEQLSYNSYTDLLAGRVLYDLTDRLDLGLEYRLLTSHLTGASQAGGVMEIGCKLLKNLWFSVGYSFDAFDTDLTGDYTDQGWFARLRFKFDEKSLSLNN